MPAWQRGVTSNARQRIQAATWAFGATGTRRRLRWIRSKYTAPERQTARRTSDSTSAVFTASRHRRTIGIVKRAPGVPALTNVPSECPVARRAGHLRKEQVYVEPTRERSAMLGAGPARTTGVRQATCLKRVAEGESRTCRTGPGVVMQGWHGLQ